MGFGLGTTWYYKKGKNRFADPIAECVQITKDAIEAGYRHLDTAEMYGTETELGDAVRQSGVPRSEFFICTKVHESMDDPGVVGALDASLKRLQMDYVDLFLLHHPYNARTKKDLVKYWRSMEDLYRQGKAKAIGVSNFDRKDMEIILEAAEIKPSVIQFEYHPYHPRVGEGYVKWLQKQDIVVEAFFGLSPLIYGQEKALANQGTLTKIAKKHGVSEAAVLQRWLLDQDVVSLNTTSRKERIPQAFEALNFKLQEEDIEEINSVGQSDHIVYVNEKGFGPDQRDKREY
jgi:diketogulonate reductase-like aldo/keto reductase